MRVRRDREFVVQPREVGFHAGRGTRLRAGHEPCREQADPVHQERDRAPGMRDDQPQARAAFQGPAEHQVRHGARGVEDELDQRGNIAERGLLDAGRQRRMEEDHGLAPVKLVEHRIKPAVAEVNAVVVGQQHDAVQPQRPERVVDLGQRGVGVGQRKARKAAEPAWVAADCLGRRLV